MSFNRFIIVSALSHALLVFIIGLISFNAVRELPVYQVDIVSPFENEKAPPARPITPRVIQPPPPVQKYTKPLVEENVKPESLFDKGPGMPRPDSTKQERSPMLDASAQRGTPGEGSGPSSPKSDGEGTAPSEKGPPALAPPSALFDRSTIEKFAKKEPPADKDKEFTFDTSEFRHRGYMRMLKEKIESTWQYPKEAARLGISGDLYIKFTIKKDGKLGDVELLRTSGYKDLDDAAIKALKDAQPFWPLPADWDKEDLEIKGYFIYIYGSTYVM